MEVLSLLYHEVMAGSRYLAFHKRNVLDGNYCSLGKKLLVRYKGEFIFLYREKGFKKYIKFVRLNQCKHFKIMPLFL